MTISKANLIAYLSSLSAELSSQAERVRNLIGESHWWSDGAHKEHLVKTVISRHLPAGMIAARGFVVAGSGPDRCSREQDLLIVDTLQEAPLFRQGGLVVSYPSAIVAAVSVKTQLAKRELADTISCLHTVRSVAAGPTADPRRIWCGGFFFTTGKALSRRPGQIYDYLQQLLPGIECQTNLLGVTSPRGPDCLASAEHLFLRSDFDGEDGATRVLGFTGGILSAGLFLAHLISHLSAVRGAPAALPLAATEIDAPPLTPSNIVIIA